MGPDHAIRLAAFKWLEEQSALYNNAIPRGILTHGFQFRGQIVSLIGQRGIWKPRMMELPISITTSPDGPYRDVLTDDDYIEYRYQGTDPNAWDNALLRETWKTNTPLIYFFKLQKGSYFAMWPAFIQGDDQSSLTFTVSVDDHQAIGDNIADDASVIGRRSYVTRLVKQRLHQSKFRVDVLGAYKEQCTLCRLKHTELLDAAHIIPDSEPDGEPVVQNGLSLCKIHHAAYDHNIIGINPDYEVRIREDVLEEIDGPMLKFGLQSLDRTVIQLPKRKGDWPDRERLERRWSGFLGA